MSETDQPAPTDVPPPEGMDMLTPSEIERLRQKKNADLDFALAAFKHVAPSSQPPDEGGGP